MFPTPTAPPSPPVVRARRPSPVLLLGLLLVVLAGVFAALTWERWLPAQPVRVARVAAIPASAEAAVVDSATPRFQAAGWIEADPLPLRVTALVGGVVAAVHVLEGETVEAGQPLATLDDADHRLAVARARSELEAATAAVAVAEREAATAAAERERLASRVAVAEARVAERRDLAERLAKAERAFTARERRQAELALATAEAERDALASEAAVLDAERERALAQVAQARAQRAVRAVALERAELDLERTVIRAPAAGVIAHLHAVPGRKQLLGADDPSSTTVAELFDPARLQARIDVPLADAAGIALGQRVELATEALPDARFPGEVTRVVGEADIARNTLQVKVRLHEGHPLLRPGMLVRATFMGTAEDGGENVAGGGRLRLVLPAVAVPAEGAATLWVVDAEGRAERRSVRLGPPVAGGGVLVLEGLGPGELVVIDPPSDLDAGERLEVVEVVG